MNSPKKDQPQQRCCLGLLYYSEALQAEGKKPVSREGRVCVDLMLLLLCCCVL